MIRSHLDRANRYIAELRADIARDRVVIEHALDAGYPSAVAVVKRASASRPSGEAHHEDRMPTRGYVATREGCDGGIRQELAAGASS
jgi:hypothetical protein